MKFLYLYFKRNVLLTDNEVAKICDLGISKEMIGTIHTNSIAGTMWYMSPELQRCIFSDSEEYSFNTDVWYISGKRLLLLLFFIHFLSE